MIDHNGRTTIQDAKDTVVSDLVTALENTELSLDDKVNVLLAQNAEILAYNRMLADHIAQVQSGIAKAMEQPMLKALIRQYLPGGM